ncbi:MAG: ABC transporter substrate-binding protein [Oscillospiraceae bacterium]|nr:ABC transporter substrate-binding protein [Oscillospiraceae bacterium]
MKIGLSRAIRAISVLACICLLSACGARERAVQALVDVGLIARPEVTQVVLAVPVPLSFAEENTGFIKGIELAREDITAMEMPIHFEVRIDDDKGDFASAVELAQGYINDHTVIGVIGHWFSNICIPISSIYTMAEQTLIVPTVSIPSLTLPLSGYVFRNIPADDQISIKMSDYAVSQGTKRAVIYYEYSMYGFEMSAFLEQYARSVGIEIIDRVRAPDPGQELSILNRKWTALDYDTVFVVSNVEEGAVFVNAIRAFGFEGAIICSDGMDSASLIRLLNHGAGNLVVSSIFHSERPPAGIVQFQQRYTERYGTPPDVWAIQGYDSVMIVAAGVAEHGVTTSAQLSEYLSSAESLGSIFGQTSFNERYEIIGKSVYLKKLAGTRFEYIN